MSRDKIGIHSCYVHRHNLVNVNITRIQRVNNKRFRYVAISDDISTHANFQIDNYHGC